MIVLKSMEKAELIMVAMEAFPELNTRGFFTITRGNEYYFSGLQKMEIESAYKPFYEEYDFAFSVKCTYSICDCRTDSRWIRMEGDRHVYITPMLYVINRSGVNASPSQLVRRMIYDYRANVLVIDQYDYQDISLSVLKNYLSSYGLYLILKGENKPQELPITKNTITVSNKYELTHV